MEQNTGSIGSRIKALRRQRGVTAGALATSVGVTENAIRKIEAGDSKEPRFSTAMSIARALGVPPSALEGQPQFSALVVEEAPQLSHVLRVFRDQRVALEKLGVEHLAIFGSVARGDAGPQSDVDVTIDNRAHFSIFDLVAVGDILELAVSRPVDILTRSQADRVRFAERIRKESVDVF